MYTEANDLEIIIHALHNVNSPSSFTTPGHRDFIPSYESRTACGNIILSVCLDFRGYLIPLR